MDDQEIRDRALSAATMISPTDEGDPSFVLDRARMFEQYLRDGAVANSESTAEEQIEDACAYARQDLLIRLQQAATVANRSDLLGWFGRVSNALDRRESLPAPPRPTRREQYGKLISDLQSACDDEQIAAWFNDVRAALDRSNTPAEVKLPRFERFTPELHVYTARDAFAPQPPDDVEKLRDAAGVLLVRSPWVTGASSLWCWCKDDVRGPALMWTQVLNEAQLPLVDVTTEEHKMPGWFAHDDPTKSAHPERYEVRSTGPDEVTGGVLREVLVCRDCERTGVNGASRGNVVDVVEHDAYHEKQARKAEAP